MGPEKRESFDNGRYVSRIVGVEPTTCICKMGFCRDNWAEHDIYSYDSADRATVPHPADFSTISQASASVSADGPSMKIIASVSCCGTCVGKVRIFGFGSQ